MTLPFILLLFIVIFFVGVYWIRRITMNDFTSIIKGIEEREKIERDRMFANFSQNNTTLHTRLDHIGTLVSDVSRHAGAMSEVGKSMKDLQEFLKSPKIRGNIGEHILKELLTQTLPKESFLLQHTFKSGEKVDAAIKTSAGIIPIDSKFPMENFRKLTSVESDIDREIARKGFNRDIKLHIDAISRKYIVPDEGTIDYALMYVPSESVYYEVVNDPTLFEYSSEKRVLPVSPSTFYAYLKSILISFEGQKIESTVKEVIAAIKALEKDYKRVDEDLSLLQKHMTNASRALTSVTDGVRAIGGKITRTRELGKG